MDTGRIEFGPTVTGTWTLPPGASVWTIPPPAIGPGWPEHNRIVFLLNELSARIDALAAQIEAW